MTETREKTHGIEITSLRNAALYRDAIESSRRRILICAGTGCIANGSLEVAAEMERQLTRLDMDVDLEVNYHTDEHAETLITKTGCQGFCQMGPLVTILPEEILYTQVRPEDVREIVEKTIVEKQIMERLLYRDPGSGEKRCTSPEIPFYSAQRRRILSWCGRIDPEDINEYISLGGYAAAATAYTEMEPGDVCACIAESGLRGRGGGGFLTGLKWELTLRETSDRKYVVCNGDEGDPGAFMDRSVMEGNPHSVIEGMLIAARGTGANRGYVYVRMEYPLAVRRIRKAVAAAESAGILGEDVFGSGLGFRIEIKEGAGAFVCGEETALLASIEGRRGMPKPKPPFPSSSGLWGKPTVINNVETLANVPLIIRFGSDSFRSVGTPKSPGTKTFALTGDVANTGLIEIPFGATLRTIIFDIGGGITDKSGRIGDVKFKAVQIGGPSGGCLTEEHLDHPMDFDSLKEIGAMVGSGGLVVMNTETCMVQMARYFMQFTQNESCGKCVPCREGTKQMLNLLDLIISGEGSIETLDQLERIAEVVKISALCGLGKTAPNPVLSIMRYFREEYLVHVTEKRCPAGECTGLRRPVIDPEKCIGCTACVRKCPVGAISGARKEPHLINPETCINCGVCAAACKFGAIA